MQRKLASGAVNDPLEQEADQIADQVLTAPLGHATHGSPPRIQRFTGQPTTQVDIVPASIDRVLAAPGRSLGPALQQDMEQRFGYDFSQVRVHTDAQAARSAQAVNALAYTVGQNVVFGARQYQPETNSGRRLLAHELTHVVQQTQSGTTSLPQRLTRAGDQASSERVTAQTAEQIFAMPLPARQPPQPVAMTSVGVTQTPVLQRAVSPDLPTIRERLSTGLFNSVTAEEAHAVLLILKRLQQSSERDFRDTVAALEREGLVERLLANVGEADRLQEHATLRQIANARVFTQEQRTGNTTVTTTVTGSCSPARYQRVYGATTQALTWLDRAIAQTDAFLAVPGNAANTRTRDALTLHFKSTNSDIARHVRARLDHIRTDIRTVNPFTVECHDSWDPTCNAAGAYIPGGEPERMVFCSSFFTGSEQWRIETIVHEMAHTQVGGAHITDRGYAADRVLRFLSTTEALTNAESYGLYVEQLATGRTPAMPAPRDRREDCPDDWWTLLQRTIARAQRANRNAQVILADLTPGGLRNWKANQLQWLGGRTQSDIDRAKRIYNGAEERLGSRVDFECEPGGGGRCDRAETYWYALGDFHICPSWRALGSEEARISSLLSGLYGYFDLEGDNTRRRNYANLAQELTTERFPAPTLGAVLGSSAWRNDDLRIVVEPVTPRAPATSFYTESGIHHERLSRDFPLYQGPNFQNSTLPFVCKVLFALDWPGTPRPAPFTPPRVNVLFEFSARRGAFHQTVSDPRPDYSGANVALNTTFPNEFSFRLPANGALHMRFELNDPDSSTTRIYDDTIQVETERLRDMIPPGPTRLA